MQVLVENRVQHVKSSKGMTPFMMACKNGSIDIVQFLVKNGTVHISEVRDGSKQSGLSYAVAKGNFEIA